MTVCPAQTVRLLAFGGAGPVGPLLDSDRGGHCRLAADFAGEGTVRRLYMPGTPVLITRFMAPEGVGEVIDFLEPIASRVPAARHRLIRVARVVRGSLPFEDHGTDLHLQASGPVRLHADGVDVASRFTLNAGESATVILTSETDATAAGGGRPGWAMPTTEEIVARLDTCRDFWLARLKSCRYQGSGHERVARSAITLKLLTYAPTGVIFTPAALGLLVSSLGAERLTLSRTRLPARPSVLAPHTVEQARCRASRWCAPPADHHLPLAR
ncbi:hypothetical protein [Streptomyces sp. NPDC004266]|uniref:hypothetical protein n=1 Tax=Streptomyces sp. NPDC004266 TaxID=3364693 RepID=UPI0036C4B42C